MVKSPWFPVKIFPTKPIWWKCIGHASHCSQFCRWVHEWTHSIWTEKESGRYVKISDKRSAIYIYYMSYIWKNLYEDIKKYVSFVFKRTLPQCSRHLEQHFWNSQRLAIDAIGYWARRCLQSSLAASIQASRFIQTSECSFESEENRFNMVMGSIPINTIFSGMNILGFTRGTRVLTHCHILKPLRLSDGVDEGGRICMGFQHPLAVGARTARTSSDLTWLHLDVLSSGKLT